jgi:hypothetical protein
VCHAVMGNVTFGLRLALIGIAINIRRHPWHTVMASDMMGHIISMYPNTRVCSGMGYVRTWTPAYPLTNHARPPHDTLIFPLWSPQHPHPASCAQPH